jgi:hypothetical protein
MEYLVLDDEENEKGNLTAKQRARLLAQSMNAKPINTTRLTVNGNARNRA